MKWINTMKLNIIGGLLISLTLAIKGSVKNDWFYCMGFTKNFSCGFFDWIFQVIVIAILASAVLFAITGLIDLIFGKKNGKKKKEDDDDDDFDEFWDDEIEDSEEPKEKKPKKSKSKEKVIKI